MSKDAVSVTLDKKGLVDESTTNPCKVDTVDADTYNKPVRVLSVEMEEALKAGHCVDLASDMQFCATVTGIDATTTPNARSRVWYCLVREALRDRCEALGC